MSQSRTRHGFATIAASLPGVASRTKIGVLAALGTELAYGASFVFTKDATSRTDPITLLGWRFAVALAVLGLLVALRVVKLSVTRATIGPLLVLAALQPGIYYLAETYGVMRTTATESGLIISAIPVVAIVAAALIVRARPTRRQLTGIAITTVGVVLTVLAGGMRASFDARGYLFLLGAVVSYAIYAAFAERYAHTTDIDRTFVMVAAGAVLFGGLALTQHTAAGTLGELARLPFDNPGFGGAVLYLALAPTIAAFFLQNLAIRELGATRYSTFIGVSTLAAVISAVLVLGERPGGWQLLGGAAILAGVYLANRVSAGPTRFASGRPTIS